MGRPPAEHIASGGGYPSAGMERSTRAVTVATFVLRFATGLTGALLIFLLADFPQLAALAWQIHGVSEVSAREAFDIYARNERHIDPAKLTPEEEALIANLNKVFGNAHGV